MAIKVPCCCALSQPIGWLPITRRPTWAVVAAPGLGGFGGRLCRNRDRDMRDPHLSALRPALKRRRKRKKEKRNLFRKLYPNFFLPIQTALFPVHNTAGSLSTLMAAHMFYACLPILGLAMALHPLYWQPMLHIRNGGALDQPRLCSAQLFHTNTPFSSSSSSYFFLLHGAIAALFSSSHFTSLHFPPSTFPRLMLTHPLFPSTELSLETIFAYPLSMQLCPFTY